MLKEVPKLPEEKTQTLSQETPKFDDETLLAVAMLINTNGYVQNRMAGDSRYSKHERAARALCSKICQGMAEAALALNGAGPERVSVLMKACIDQIKTREAILVK